MDKQRLLLILTIIAIASVIAVYAVIQYYGQVTTKIPVGQAILIDSKLFNETITETLAPTYGGCTVYANHTLENKGSENAQIKFILVNITDSKGNLVTDNSVTVSWLVEGQSIIQPVTITGISTVKFSIVIHFHYAIMSDIYTINTQVKPYIP